MLRRISLAAAGAALVALQVVGATPAGAATVSPNVNITRLGGNQSEAAIAIDPDRSEPRRRALQQGARLRHDRSV